MRARLVGLVLTLGAVTAPRVWADCTQTNEIIAPAGGIVTTLATVPSRVCSVEFFATAANGFGQVYDSPTTSETAALAKNVSEPGAATAGNWVTGWFGINGRTTRYGLYVTGQNGRIVISWNTGP